jgi:acetolactate synthase-1/3 small subunit
MLIAITAPPERRSEVLSLIEMFKGKVVDIGQKFVMVEVSGPEEKIEAFINVCKPYGIKSVARTGTIAMARHTKTELRPGQTSNAQTGQ